MEKLVRREGGGNTFGAIALEMLAMRSKKNAPSTVVRNRRIIEKDLIPYIGDRPITELSAPELLVVLRKMERRGAIETAHRAPGIAGMVFRYTTTSQATTARAPEMRVRKFRLIPLLLITLFACASYSLLAQAGSVHTEVKTPVTPPGDYAWMQDFSGKHAYDLYRAARFKSAVWSGFPHENVYWMSGSHGHSLPAGIYDFAFGSLMTYPDDGIRKTNGDGIAVDGYLDGSADAFKWLFWSDAKSPKGKLIFALFFRSQKSGENSVGTLDIYTDRREDLSSLPQDFLDALSGWKTKIGASTFSRATIHGATSAVPFNGN